MTMQAEPTTELVVATQPQADALVKAVSQREIAEAQGAMLLAQRFPRDVRQARDRILQACERPALAEVATYIYNRGGTEITGPSIRLAEVMAQNWGNLHFGIRELEQRPGESTMQAYAWDLETNVRQERFFQIKHTRHTKQGSYALEDPRDIYELVANQGARRLRACILGIIPRDIVEEAVAQCDATTEAKAEITPERIKALLVKFSEFGVTKEQIETRLQRNLESIQPAQYLGLGKIYNSLKDGMSGPADWFSVGEAEPTTKTGTEAVKDKLKRPKVGVTQEGGEVGSPSSPTPEDK